MTVQFEVVNPRTLEMQRNESNRLDLIEQVQTIILEQIFIYFFLREWYSTVLTTRI